jgi:hypothetical protein
MLASAIFSSLSRSNLHAIAYCGEELFKMELRFLSVFETFSLAAPFRANVTGKFSLYMNFFKPQRLSRRAASRRTRLGKSATASAAFVSGERD